MDSDKNVRVEFYRLIQLGVRSSGQAYLDAVKPKLEMDGLWNYLSEKLVSVTTDGAGNMASESRGFSALLMKDLGRSEESLLTVCFAHKLGI